MLTVQQVLLRGLLAAAAALGTVVLGARQVEPRPDLLAVVVGAVALRGGWRTGLGIGLAAGWCADLLPPGAALLGTSALTYAAAGALAGRLQRPGPVSWLLLAWAALAVAGVARAVEVLLALAGAAPVDGRALATGLVVTATFGLLLGPLVVRLDRRAGGPR